MDKIAFRAIKQDPGLYQCATSGSTGTPIVVQKYREQQQAAMAASGLLHRWHGWDRNAKTLRVSFAASATPEIKGNYVFCNQYVETDCTQYLGPTSTLPKDTTQFERIAVTGERWEGIGIDLYTTEEFGVIAIQCPYNSSALHIMPHLSIKFANDGSMAVTDHTHPYLKDYEIGDVAEPVTCGCGINLSAISHVKGRIRNQILMADGSYKFPTFGLRDCLGIDRFQVIQKSQNVLEFRYAGEIPDDLTQRICAALGQQFDIRVMQGGFVGTKHEEFICEIPKPE